MTDAETVDLDWLTPLAGRGSVVGLARPLLVELLVQKTPDGDQRFAVTFDAADGEAFSADDDSAEPVELIATYPNALAIASGELNPNVAWMSGRLKSTGPTGPWLAVLALAESET